MPLSPTRLRLTPRRWPPVVAANDLWRETWHIPAGQVGLDITVDGAITAANEWTGAIADAKP